MKFLLFIAAVIALGVFTVKLKKHNRKVFKDALNEFLNEDIVEEPKATVQYEKKENNNDKEEEYVRAVPRENKTVIIPENFEFKEEIEILLYMDEKFPDLVKLTLYEPKRALEISLFEERTGIRLTEDLKALYMFTNGLDVDRGTLEFEQLEMIEREYKQGYCDWTKEGDSDDYYLVGSVIGDGEYLCVEKKTGHIFWHDEGNMTDYVDVENILYWVIEFIYEGYIDDGNERIEKYLEKMKKVE